MTTLYLGQAETDHANLPLIDGDVKYLASQTIAQDAARVDNLVDMTLMARVGSTGYWTPLRDVDPASTPGSMLTGVIGSVSTFQAVADGSFKIAIDGETVLHLTGLDFTGIQAPTATGATMKTGALGCTLATLQGITDGAFNITVDGQVIAITGLDFSDIYAPTDTFAQCVCGVNGALLAAWQAVLNGGFGITVDGTLYTFTDIDFSGIATLGEIALVINSYVGGAGVRCAYNAGTNKFTFYSTTRGRTSTITAVVAGGTTDISGAGFLNGLTGTAVLTQGAGGDGLGTAAADVINAVAAGRFEVFYEPSTTKFLFLSPRRGAISTITALSAPGAGTDVSGATRLNGLTGTAVLVQGTGDAGNDRTIVDVINDAAAGRFRAIWAGTKIRFISPTLGVNSAVSVLTAGTSGTDISGASYLNGLTGTGVATAGTGLDGSHLPAGIYRGGTILAATIAAGTTLGSIVIPGGITVNESLLTLENSLTMDSVITEKAMRIRDYLHSIGIYPRTSKAADAQI